MDVAAKLAPQLIELLAMNSTAAGSKPRKLAGIDLDQAPFTVIWEVTRACDLRCVHCRADAQRQRDPRELTTGEGKRLLAQVRELGSPVFIFTGGDPLRRPDLFALIDHAVELGLNVAITPSGTPLLTADVVRRFRAHGVRRMGLSLDGPDAPTHDAFRQQPGSFAWSVAALGAARACGLATQINTTVTRRNVHQLERMSQLVGELGAVTWSLFFLVRVGRAQATDQLTAQEFEDVFAFLYELSQRVPFQVRTTAAPHYRRYVLQRQVAERRRQAAGVLPLLGTIPQDAPNDMPGALQGVTDGRGLLFISHIGEVYPSGFLPLVVGHVREAGLADIYRTSPLLRALRDVRQWRGKCRECEFARVCGGSRARAFAEFGDPLAEEPLCLYQPRQRGQCRALSGRSVG
ncbi:MAG: TIGR04053 family radical SAM/SPASM domain-containing protein [Candidatus Binatia bacterium]|nr:TIGR04053 family radical SAM/SPASM domain-containing protein [Candidatus Binatia bacterium]